MDATDQAELVRSGAAKPSELVEAAIERAERLEPRLRAIVSRQFDRARVEAASGGLPQGVLSGVPYLLKDLGAYLDGDPVYSGMQALLRADFRESGDAHFAGRLRAAGMLSLGRANSPELGILPATEPLSTGPSHNPWSLRHSPGGSSGGSAAAVAAGVVPVAHASDGGGSIRIPASHCGLVGLKPSRGRNSFAPASGERWGGCSCEGFVTRSVRDTALMLDVTHGPGVGDPYTAPPPARPYVEEVGQAVGELRIGVMTRGPRDIEVAEDCSEAARRAGVLLDTLGHAVEVSHPEALDDAAAPAAFVGIVTVSTARAIDRAAQRIATAITAEDVEPLTWALAEIGRGRGAVEYLEAIETMHRHGRRLAGWWQQGFDLLVTPTCAAPPPPIGTFAQDPEEPLASYARAAPFGAFTLHFNLSGQPAISLPLHWSAQGLPVGVQLVAAFGREDLLIRVAAQLEQAAPWADRLPPVHASRA
ncbi:MAG: amidase [Deltaproteobacteria bacterium]|nr:amidase [Deltaproteobacteria bacterium]MBW2360879.1 amidase [Deltaproteobacteria bacterium]